MELKLQPLAAACCVSGRTFQEGDRVTSFLVWTAEGGAARYDVREESAAGFAPEGTLACRWTHVHKPRSAAGDAERALKLTAENLFLTLADPSTEPTAENTRMVQFLALMLERKRILRMRGRTPDRSRLIYEHVRSRQPYEVPAGELGPEFFAAVRGQLSVLVGEPPAASEPAVKLSGPA